MVNPLISLRKVIVESIKERKIRYILAGGWNTVFGYGIGNGIYYGLGGKLHVLLVGALAYVISSTMSFITYKLFVFRTKGGWLSEYMKSYVVYGVTAGINIVLLWMLVDGVGVPFWLAQLIMIVFVAVVSYLSHSRFTFYRKEG
jgi:putative flippase GtrA